MTHRGYGHNEGGNEAKVHLFKCHTDEVKRIVTEQSPSTFLTVAGVSGYSGRRIFPTNIQGWQDHTVRQHDLRTPHTCPRCPPPLVKASHALNALGSSPLTPWYFVVAGYNKYVSLLARSCLRKDIDE